MPWLASRPLPPQPPAVICLLLVPCTATTLGAVRFSAFFFSFSSRVPATNLPAGVAGEARGGIWGRADGQVG